MPTSCDIEFDNNPSCTFFGGENLTTKVSLHLDEDKEINGIAFKIRGYGHMHWVDNNNSYTRSEDYINIKTFLLGTPTSKSITLNAGKHTFSYDYSLPITCPSSVESPYVKIRYKVKVILIRQFQFEKDFSKEFTVLKLVDLNKEPMILCPVKEELEKKFGTSRKPSPPLSMSASLPRSGYVPGEKIPVSVSITNESGIVIKKLKISLVMKTRCHGNRPVHKIYEWLSRVSKFKQECKSDEYKQNSIFELPVPPTPPSDDKYSSLIEISYEVHIKAVMPIMYENQVLILPVFIGNVPIRNEELTETLPTMPWRNESVIPPPSYEEAMNEYKSELK